MTTSQLSQPLVASLDAARFVWLRAGKSSDHKFTGVWVVVVKGRVFVRSYWLTPGGWFDQFLGNPFGAISVDKKREIRIRARRVRGERLLNAIESGYASKYITPASKKYVRGFRSPRRRAATIEFVRRG